MDPDEALDGARRRASEITAQLDAGAQISVETVMRLVDDFTALDEWLTRGGFCPRRWQKAFAGPVTS